MCGTMGSKNQVDYVRSVLALVTSLFVTLRLFPHTCIFPFSFIEHYRLFRARLFVDKNKELKQIEIIYHFAKDLRNIEAVESCLQNMTLYLICNF